MSYGEIVVALACSQNGFGDVVLLATAFQATMSLSEQIRSKPLLTEGTCRRFRRG